MKKCNDCLAHYTGEHTCPPWLRALKSRYDKKMKKTKNSGKVMAEEIKSEVIVKHGIGKGFWIIVKDQYTKNSLAITREELERVVLYGQVILLGKDKYRVKL